jgi:hypothetical protein
MKLDLHTTAERDGAAVYLTKLIKERHDSSILILHWYVPARV